MPASDILIRPLVTDEWREYRDLRLSALADAPDAYGSTLVAEQDHPDAHWQARLRSGAGNPNDLPLVAVVGSDRVGLVWGKIDGSDPAVAYIYQMWVTPTHRRVGIGEALLRALVSWASSRGANRMALWVTYGDSPARRHYQRVGFVADGEPSPLRPGAALLAQKMTLDLTTSHT